MTLTAREVSQPFVNVDFGCLPDWKSFDTLQRAFERVRDERFLIQDNLPKFHRRIPWLFSENGCFARAELVRQAFAKWGYPPIKKVFLFGNMSFRTILQNQGNITFKDHVAVALRVKNKAYVIDPPLEVARPLELTKWTQMLSVSNNFSDLKISICNELTFSHNSNHEETNPARVIGIRKGKPYPVEYFVQEFLRQERTLLEELELEVDRVLGADPPWM